MKDLLFRALMLCFLAVAALGCGPDPKPEPEPEKAFAVEVKTAAADFVEFTVSAPAEVEMAYIVDTESQDKLGGAVLFATGTVAKVKDGDVLKVTENIAANTSYYFYAVAKLDDKTFSDIVKLEFTTADYNFNELITVVDTYYDGYKVHLTIPQEIKDKGNVIRYTATSLAVYNVNKSSYAGIENLLDAQSIVSNGDPWGNYAKNDSTIIYNAMNECLLDEDGNPVLDENGNTIDIHNPITPGEPSIFLAGECRYGTFDEMGDILGYYYGIQGKAYVVPLFNPDTYEWTGLFQKKEFFAKQPTECAATVNIEIPEDEISVIDANIYFNVEEGVERYFYMVLDNSTYNQVVDIYLDGKPEWFQWFLTSFIAFYEWGIGAETESIQVNAASSFYEPLVGGETYHVVCTVMGDEAGATQKFIHKTFTTKQKSKRAPTVEVTPVYTVDPSFNSYNASFNIRCTSASDNPLVGAYGAGHYTREFQYMFNSGYTYETLLKGNNPFTSEELAKINSPEGLTISFPTIDSEITRMAVYGCNDEYTFNNIDKDKEGAGWADYEAPYAPAADMIDSPYYSALEGDWTASATVRVLVEQEDGSTAYKTMEYKSKVNIGSSIPGIPDQIESYVYDLYNNKSKNEVDGMFNELLLLADQFSENRVINQNRLLCSGFIDYDYYDPCRMAYMSPYDLFKSVTYKSVDVPQLIYDFGPKWYFEVQPDGSLIVPYSSTYLPPMHSWPGYAFYLGGLCDGNGFIDSEGAEYNDLPGFPVEVSADNNTITIKPIVRGENSYYMNSIGIADQGSEVIATIISDIVLTRGWTDTKAMPASVPATPVKINTITAEGNSVTELPELRIFKSLSDFSKVEPLREYKTDETPNVVTMDMVNKTTQKILNNELR